MTDGLNAGRVWIATGPVGWCLMLAAGEKVMRRQRWCQGWSDCHHQLGSGGIHRDGRHITVRFRQLNNCSPGMHA